MNCALCSSATGDLFHCLAECVAFNDLRMEWCRRCSVPPATVAFWVRHPWLFNPESSGDTPTLIHAHVAFAGQACERARARTRSLSLSLSLFESQSTVFLAQLPSVLSMLPPSPLLQGSHSTCCGWCSQTFFPASGPPHRLLWVLFSTDFLCAALTVYLLSFSCSPCPVQGRYCRPAQSVSLEAAFVYLVAHCAQNMFHLTFMVSLRCVSLVMIDNGASVNVSQTVWKIKTGAI